MQFSNGLSKVDSFRVTSVDTNVVLSRGASSEGSGGIDTSGTPQQQHSNTVAASPQSSVGTNNSPMGMKEEDDAVFIDEFGFELHDDKAIEEEQHFIKSIDGRMVLRRVVKWQQMAANWAQVSGKMSDKLKERCRKGVPSKCRGIAWQLLVGSHEEMEKESNRGVYGALVRKPFVDPELEGVIERDLGRTFPTHVLFRQDNGSGQAILRNILHAYAVVDPEVGYVQGMGYIVGALLTQMPEEEAFWCFYMLMYSDKYRLRDMYRPGFPMLQLMFFQLKCLLQQQLPKLAQHLQDMGADMSFFASQWFLTLFVYHFQFRALLRVWDIFMMEGWKIVFRVAIALMKSEEKALLGMTLERLLPSLKSLHEGKSAEEIISLSLKIKFKTQELAKLRAVYEKHQGNV